LNGLLAGAFLESSSPSIFLVSADSAPSFLASPAPALAPSAPALAPLAPALSPSALALSGLPYSPFSIFPSSFELAIASPASFLASVALSAAFLSLPSIGPTP